MAWDDACEEKACMLLAGFVADPKKPPLEEQQAVANWLNQMLPYPGWVFELSLGARYWMVDHKTLGTIVCGVFVDNEYTHSNSQKSSHRLMEMITQLEMGL